jgi:large subunit ribosomal protein L15
MTKRLPKMRGFNNRFKVEYTPVNLDELDRMFEAGDEVSPVTLAALGLLSGASAPVVVLARGEITKPLSVKANRVSAKAKEKIEAAGGAVELSPFDVTKRLPRS